MLDRHRQINLHDYWWSDEYAFFKSEMLDQHGFDVRHVYFSGFWSQGDGACFVGAVQDWHKFLGSLAMPELEHPFVKDFAQSYWYCSVQQTGSYYHEYSMQPSFDLTNFSEFRQAHNAEPLLVHLQDALFEAIDYENLENTATEFLRDKAKELYRRLEKEYEYLTSDEAVYQALVDCELLEDEIREVTDAAA